MPGRCVPGLTGSVTVGASDGSGSVNVDSGGQLTAASLSIDSGSSLTEDATVEVGSTNTAGSVSNAGAVTIGRGGTLDVLDSGSVTNQATGTATLQGGSLTAGSLVNAGLVKGYGSVSPQITNTGTVEASGGTLTASNGVTGSGTVQTDNGATLAIGADSTAATLANNGTVDIGGNSVTVASDYNSASFGTGNSFNAHANVTGTGQIDAAGSGASTAQTLTIAVDGGTASTTSSPTASIAFGNVHVGGVSSATYTIGNANTGGPQLRGAIQTVNGSGTSTITDSSLAGTGVTAQSFAPIQAGGSSNAYTVDYTPTAAGALSGQAVHIANNFDNVDQQTIGITGTAYAYATPTVTSSLPSSNGVLNFGVVQAGQTKTDQLTIANTLVASSAQYQEGLDASFGTPTNAQLTASGAITNLAAGKSDNSSMAVTLDPTSSGAIGGSVQVSFASDGATTSGLGITPLSSQSASLDYTWTVQGTVINQANASITPTTVNFGNVREGSTQSQALTVENVPSGSQQAYLDAQISGAKGVPGTTGSATANGGSISGLAAGAKDATSLSVGLDTASAGAQSGAATIDLQSDSALNGCTSDCIVSLNPQTVNVQGSVFRLATGSAQDANLGATREGGTLSGNIAVTNTAAADGYSENLDAAISGSTPAVSSTGGTVTGLAAGKTNGSGLTVALDTGTSGNVQGTATVQFQSDGTGIDGGAAIDNGSQTVNVTGQVYTTAVSQVNTQSVNFGIVHVGDSVATQAVSVSNVAAKTATSLNDVLQGSLGTSGPFTATGDLGTGSAGVVAGGRDGSSLQVGLNTTHAGVYSGSASFSGTSHDAVLSDVAAQTQGSQSVTLSGQVNSYANAVFQLDSGSSGSLSVSGSRYTLDLGNITRGATNINSLLSLVNDVAGTGPSDLLEGSFSAGTLADASLAGSSWSTSFSGLGAGGSIDGLGINFDTASLGAFNDTISFNGQGYYTGASYSPYGQSLTLTLQGDIVNPAAAPEMDPDTALAALTLLAGLLAIAGDRRRRLRLRAG